MTVVNATDPHLSATSAALGPAAREPNFEARWVAWQERGVARERAFMRRVRLAAIVATPLTLGALWLARVW